MTTNVRFRQTPFHPDNFAYGEKHFESPAKRWAFSFLETSMKSEYRCLVEAIICCEQKLREAKAIQRDAQEKLNQANGFVAYQEASLRENEQRLAELEEKMLSLEV